MTTRRTKFALVMVVATLVAACSGSAPLARIASTSGTIGTGTQRVIIAMVDPETQAFLASEDAAATALLRDEDGTPIGTYDLDFLWTVPGVRGVYVGYFDIPAAGVYQVSVTQDGHAETPPSGFVAVEDPIGISLGEPAPLSDTRTSSDVADLSLITTDPEPDPSLYELSIADAVTNGRPSVIVFATPAFCTTQACGPMLAQVSDLARDHPGVDFVHVEVYEDLQVDDFNDLEPVDAVIEWELPSEPWVYVVDAGGVVVAAFEGALGDRELTSVLEGLSQ